MGAKRFEKEGADGCHDTPVCRTGLANHLGHGAADIRAVFHFYEKTMVGSRHQDFFQGGNPDAGSPVRKGLAAVLRKVVRGIQRLKFRQGFTSQVTGAVGGAVHGEVMHEYDLTIGGQLRIHLQQCLRPAF